MVQSFNGILSQEAVLNHKLLCEWKRIVLVLQSTALLPSQISFTLPMEIRQLGELSLTAEYLLDNYGFGNNTGYLRENYEAISRCGKRTERHTCLQ